MYYAIQEQCCCEHRPFCPVSVHNWELLRLQGVATVMQDTCCMANNLPYSLQQPPPLVHLPPLIAYVKDNEKANPM